MKLYFAPGTISIAVAIALEEAELAYDAIKVDFATAEQTKAEYLALNPKGRVPTLVTTSGTRLTETGAILDYIATLAPDKRLVPADAETAAHMRSIMYYLASTMHVNHAHKMRGHRWADAASSLADMTSKVTETMTASAAYIEASAFLGDYVCGKNLTLADPYLFVVCNWLAGDGVNVADFPKISAFLDRMNRRPSVQKIIAAGML